MLKLRVSPTVGFVATIASVALVASISSVQACPFSGSKSAYQSGGQSDVSSQANSIPGRLNTNYLGMAGLGIATVGLFAAGVIHRIRRARQVTEIADSILFEHPEWEHPEVAIASLPKEALSSSRIDQDLLLTR
jgi:hypothetical protein